MKPRRRISAIATTMAMPTTTTLATPIITFALDLNSAQEAKATCVVRRKPYPIRKENRAGDTIGYDQHRYRLLLSYKMSYELLTDMNVLYDAFRKCRSGVDWKCSVQKYEANVLAEINSLRRRLENGTYTQAAFYEFNICERGKNRHIRSLTFRDRVVQRALCDYILNPALQKYLIYDNGASVKGKGIDFARERLRAHLQKYYRKHGNVGYILIMDFSKFFDSIPHEGVLRATAKHIDDERTMALIRHMVSTFDSSEEPRSLGIGSQISQILGIYYPTTIDNYCKIVRGCKYYGRYMDDLYVIHSDKGFLKELQQELFGISEELGLTVNVRKTQIYRIDKGFTYLKQRIFVTETGKVIRKPCKKNVTRERRKLKKFRRKVDSGEMQFEDVLESYKSWRGNVERFNSYRTLRNMDSLFSRLYGDYLDATGKSIKPKRS